MYIAECTGMDKAFKAQAIYAACVKLVEESMPGINQDSARELGKIKAEALIYSRITHNEFDTIIDGLKKESKVN
jgi:hypothetical protein